MTKKLLSILLISVMMISSFSMLCFDASAATMAFTVTPMVLIGGGGEYNIVWENNNVGIGYVTYQFGGMKYTVYDEENGVVRSDDKTHTVRIPQEHLDKAGEYTVHASIVSSRDGYNIVTSESATWSSSFHGYTGQKKITMGCTSDTHLIYASKNAGKYKSMIAAMKQAVEGPMQRPDIVLLNGDITNELIHKEEYYALFEMIRIAGSDGSYPVLYVVGNHEKRGFYSKEIEKYLCYDTGEFYSQFDYGPLSAFIIDIGEDKEDDHLSYSNPGDPVGLIDMERYHAEQLKYFEDHSGYTDGSVYNITISHGPSYIGNSRYEADQASFGELFNNYGTDLHLAGHIHRMQYNSKVSHVPYPTIYHASEANGKTVRSMLMTMEDGQYTLKGMDATGAQLWLHTVKADNKGAAAPKPEQKEQPTNTVETSAEQSTVTLPTTAGMSTASIKGASDKTANITKPVVFDAGEYYSVVWQTTAGVKCAGYVDVSGVSKTFMDQHGGKLRTETTHSVRIPKDVMYSGKNYTIKSRVVTNYNGYGANSSIDKLTFGSYAKGVGLKFNAQPNSKTSKFTILAVANKTADVSEAQKVTSIYKTVPNLVVLSGDLVAHLNSEKDFGKLLDYANMLSKGAAPVMLLRGENETKGAFAAYLPRILHNYSSTYNINRLYTTYSASKLSVIGLDTATTKKDSDSSYNGFANFDGLRREQADWVENKIPKAFSSDYNIVFANASDLTNCVGVDLTKGFEKHKIHLVVSAGTETKFVGGGKFYSQATIGNANALVITCKGEEISVQSVTDAVSDLGKLDTSAVTYGGNQPPPPIEENNPYDDAILPDDTPKQDDDSQKEENKQQDTNKDEEKTPSEDDSESPEQNTQDDDSIDFEDVDDGWYNDYLKFNVSISDKEITLSKSVTELDFVYVVSRFAGINAGAFGDGSKQQKASLWACSIGLIENTPANTSISVDVANSILKSMFIL